jgi:hypothetical protein
MMGTEYKFALDFGFDDDPTNHFSEIANAFEQSSSLGQLTHLVVYKNEFFPYGEEDGENGKIYDVVLEDPNYPGQAAISKQLNYEDFSKQLNYIANHYVGGEYFLQGWWRVPRFFWTKKRTTITQEMGGITLDVVGNNFRWMPERMSPPHILYYVGDDKRFDINIDGEAAKKNLEVVITELTFLMSIGTQHIAGLDRDSSDDPGKWSVRYHRSVQGFVNDLVGKDSGKVSLTEEQLKGIVLKCDDVKILKTEQGIVIYNQHGPRGNLGRFYEILHQTS